MSIDITIDDNGLSVALGHASAEIAKQAAKVVGKAAVNVKKTMREDAARSRHFKFAQHIGYDHYTLDGTGLTAQVGAQSRGAGNLAHIAYFGGARGGGGSVRDPQQAALAEAPRFERALAEAMEGVLE